MGPTGDPIEEILEQLRAITVDVEELTGATANFVHLNRTDFRALQVLSAEQRGIVTRLVTWGPASRS